MSGKKIVLIVVAVLILILVLLAGIGFWYSQDKPETQAVPSGNSSASSPTQGTGQNTGAAKSGTEAQKVNKPNIRYAAFDKDCMKTEFVKGYQEDTSADYYAKKDSCSFQLTYEDVDHFALLKLDQPLSAVLGQCGSSKGVWEQEGAGFSGSILAENTATINGVSAYRVLFEDAGYKYVNYYICFSSPKYNGEKMLQVHYF